jgi:protein PhnA
MAKGYQANKEHQEEISLFGKAIGKRAGFKCEWCGHKEELRIWDYRPEAEPELETLALLCQRCREWATGKKAAANELHDLRNALWSDIPAVAEGAARVLAQCRDAWAREAIEESFIDDALKAELLK